MARWSVSNEGAYRSVRGVSNAKSLHTYLQYLFLEQADAAVRQIRAWAEEGKQWVELVEEHEGGGRNSANGNYNWAASMLAGKEGAPEHC